MHTPSTVSGTLQLCEFCIDFEVKTEELIDFYLFFWGILERSFQVGKNLELRFEFRTTEVNGVILSVAEPNGFPAISIELHKGKVRGNRKIENHKKFREISYV